MLIDWFTVGAQTLNFIILVWLMKRFLYQPILNAIDAREEKIADELAHADKVSLEANQAKASFDKKNLEFEQHKEQLMLDVTEQANSERQRLLEETRKTLSNLQIKQQNALQNQMHTLHDSIRQAAQKELFNMAKNALSDLAEVDINAQIVAVFVKQLREMPLDQKRALQTALSTTKINVVSSHVLSPDQQSTITDTLEELLGKDIQLLFTPSPDLIGGIKLSANGFKIGWSVSEYIQSLEDALAEQINKHTNVHNKTSAINAQTTGNTA